MKPPRTGRAAPAGPGTRDLPATPGPGNGQVRIIGGRWRGTRLAVADKPGLRPTADRVRETLFNWLGPSIQNARVLDLFAGTGALGLEALSRGAASAVLVERESDLAATLRANAVRLGAADAVEVAQADALAYLARPAVGLPFELAFVDPPFASLRHVDDWTPLLAALLPRLAPGARVYLESPAAIAPMLPVGWSRLREGETREVRYGLYQQGPAARAPAAGPDESPAGAATLPGSENTMASE